MALDLSRNVAVSADVGASSTGASTSTERHRSEGGDIGTRWRLPFRARLQSVQDAGLHDEVGRVEHEPLERSAQAAAAAEAPARQEARAPAVALVVRASSVDSAAFRPSSASAKRPRMTGFPLVAGAPSGFPRGRLPGFAGYLREELD